MNPQKRDQQQQECVQLRAEIKTVEAHVRSIRCPQCRAPEGHACRDPSGSRVLESHLVRRQRTASLSARAIATDE